MKYTLEFGYHWLPERRKITNSYTNMFTKRKCPKCDSTEIAVMKEGIVAKLWRYTLYIMLFITLLFIRAPKEQYVCRKCGTTWRQI